MANFSFDIVSEINLSEINNVFDQVKRELGTRYDFKNSISSLNWLDDQKSGFQIVTEDELKLNAILDIIRKKLASRNISQKILDLSNDIISSNFKITYNIPFIKGLDQNKTKQLNLLIKSNYPKIKTSINNQTLKVSDSSKDNLQKVITLLKSSDLEFDIQFINYR